MAERQSIKPPSEALRLEIAHPHQLVKLILAHPVVRESHYVAADKPLTQISFDSQTESSLEGLTVRGDAQEIGSPDNLMIGLLIHDDELEVNINQEKNHPTLTLQPHIDLMKDNPLQKKLKIIEKITLKPNQIAIQLKKEQFLQADHLQALESTSTSRPADAGPTFVFEDSQYATQSISRRGIYNLRFDNKSGQWIAVKFLKMRMTEDPDTTFQISQPPLLTFMPLHPNTESIPVIHQSLKNWLLAMDQAIVKGDWLSIIQKV